MIAILGAMDREVNGLFAAMTDTVEERYGRVNIVKGKLFGKDAAVAKCGIGKVNAAIAAQTMILAVKPSLIINTGVGGSLTKDLGLLDVAVGTSAVQHDMDNSPLGDPIGFTPGPDRVILELDGKAAGAMLLAVKSAGLNGKAARIASGDRFVHDQEDKKRLRELFQADVCEEEGAAIAQTCALSDVPCSIIRAISDATDGEHGMEYAQFADIAADNAIKVIREFLLHM